MEMPRYVGIDERDRTARGAAARGGAAAKRDGNEPMKRDASATADEAAGPRVGRKFSERYGEG